MQRLHIGRRHLLMAALLFAAAYALAGWLRPDWALEAEFARLRWLAGAREHSLDAAGHRWRYVETGRVLPVLLPLPQVLLQLLAVALAGPPAVADCPPGLA